MSNVFTEEQFKNNPFIFAHLDLSITKKLNQIKRLNIGKTFSTDEKVNSYVEDKIKEHSKELENLRIIRVNHLSNEREKVSFKYEISIDNALETKNSLSEKDSINTIMFHHYILGISLNPDQKLVSEVYRNKEQNYKNQIEFENIENLEREITYHTNHLKDIRIQFAKEENDDNIEKYLKLIKETWDYVLECKGRIKLYDGELKITEDINS